MPQTATRAIASRKTKTIGLKTEIPEQRNIRPHGCPFDHTPNAETIKSFEEGAAMRAGLIPDRLYDSVEEFLADLYA